MRCLFYFLVFFVLISSLSGQIPELRFVEPVSGFNQPVDITGAEDGSERLFIVERAGLVRIYDQASETVLAANFLDITSFVLNNTGERGLLGIAFHPDYENNGFFYVNYTTVAREGRVAGSTVIARFTAASGANTVDESTELVLLNVAQSRANHNAGDLAFGPDGYLYIPLGDGGGAGDPEDASQDGLDLLGKMLRIDVDNTDAGLNYAIPPSNPYVTNPDTLDEIWAFGLRNPWRISFDRVTGDLWIADVGQDQREEVNQEDVNDLGGRNYGWDCREGLIAYDEGSDPSSPLCDDMIDYTDPVFDYGHNSSTGGFSITGGFVYRGSVTDLVGWYVCADYVSENFFLYPEGGGDLEIDNDAPIDNPSTFGEDDDGELYVAEYGGTFYRVTTAQALPVELILWEASVQSGAVHLNWSTATEKDALAFIVERSIDGSTFSEISRVAAAGHASTQQDYTYIDNQALNGKLYYRLRQLDLDGQEAVFAVRQVSVDFIPSVAPIISPNPVDQKIILRIPMTRDFNSVELTIFSSEGQSLFNWSSARESSYPEYQINLPPLASGIYPVQILCDGKSFTQRIIIK